jgi:hypothetical protein
VGQCTASINLQSGNLQVCWKEAGLGNNQLVNYTATATATATWNCVNGGGQCPDAANKTTSSENVSATGTFNSGSNGQITECLTIEAEDLKPDPTFSCPGGQTLTLSDVSYGNVAIHDDTNDVDKNCGSASATPFVCPKPHGKP